MEVPINKELNSCFKELSETLSGYESRPQQRDMAAEVLSSFTNRQKLMVEAGTGVGKSFAYLVPVILSKKKTTIATASIALQDQLVSKDLIFLQKNLSLQFSYGLLKGKSNYLCLIREQEFSELSKPYMKFREWTANTKTGDKDELAFVPDFWARVCCDSDDCNMRDCVRYEECFYYKHFRSLYKKDILVVNHHLLIYDLLSDFNLLPFHRQLVIDEAHHLESVISSACGSVLNHFRVTWLLFRLRSLKIPVDNLLVSSDSFFKRRDISPQPTSPIPDAIIEELKQLRDILSFEKMISKLDRLKQTAGDNKDYKERIDNTISYINSLNCQIQDFIKQQCEDNVYFVKKYRDKLELKSCLVEAKGPFKMVAENYESLIMTSATLTVNNNFRYIKERLGALEFREKIVGSPFDFKKQAVLYVDKELPSPNNKNREIFQQEGLPVIEALVNSSRGRALILFTSYSHLRFVADNINIDFQFKSQGEMPAGKLIQWFVDTPHSVLLATATFWQGIDIKGEKLSLVVITKIPFGSPGDPVYDERCKRLKDQWFYKLALPSATLLLRQGVGRLIRGVNDYGVVAILDTRLLKSSYGRVITSSLPQMKIVHSIEAVDSFFNTICNQVDRQKTEGYKKNN